MIENSFTFKNRKNVNNFLLEDLKFLQVGEKLNRIINVKGTNTECSWPQNMKHLKGLTLPCHEKQSRFPKDSLVGNPFLVM